MPATYSNWQSYTWKNELATQLDRVVVHGHETSDEGFAGKHNPHHMLERALVLTAFCIRRMIEKRLVTDALAQKKLSVRTLPTKTSGAFRSPFHSSSGGNFFANYDLSGPQFIQMKLKGLADEIIHSSQLMTIAREETIDDGILIVSDWHVKERMIHLTYAEFANFVRSVLDDEIAATEDTVDPASKRMKLGHRATSEECHKRRSACFS